MFEKPKAEDIIGMTGEDLKARLDAGMTKEDFAPLKEKIEAYGSSLDEIKASLAKLNTAPVVETPVVEPGDQFNELVNDPQAFVNKQTKPLADQQAEIQAQVQEMRARQNPKYSDIFSRHGDQLVAMAAKIPAQTRAGTNFWEWHIRTFLGDEVIKGNLKATSYPSLMGSSSVSPNPDGSSSDPNKGIDPDVADFLRNRNPGVPMDKFAKIMKLHADGEPVSIASYKGGNA